VRALILNWRDIKSPLAGGAEVVTHEIAKRWAEQGHDVTLFASDFPGARKAELVDGVRVVRGGGRVSVPYHAWKHYKDCFRGRYDIVIEEHNGLVPWFCKHYVHEPVVVLRHQNGRGFERFEPKDSIEHYELPSALGVFAYILEPWSLRYQKGLPILVMSESTKKDFLDLGFEEDDLTVIPEGTGSVPLPAPAKKEGTPTIIYVGRLKRSKRVDHILRAVSHVRTVLPDVQLWIVGSGDPAYERELKELAGEIGISKNTKFLGHVTDKERDSLMARAHVLVMASVREGWGLVVTEAAAQWTPAVGYDVAGLRDSISDGKTGLLAKNGDPVALGKSLVRVLSDVELREGLAKAAWERTRTLTWERTATMSLKAVRSAISRRSRPSNGTGPDGKARGCPNVLSVDLESWTHMDYVDAPSKKKKALDDGYIVRSTEETLALLEAYKVRTTFFVVGEIFDWYPDLIARIKAAGHEVGFQTHTHRILRDRKALLQELKLGKRFMDEFSPKGFRAPSMFMRKEYLKDIRDHGFGYDSSIYGPDGTFEPLDGILEVPVSTMPRFGGGPGARNGFPRPLEMGLILREVPFGSGFYIGLKSEGVGRYIERSNRDGVGANLFVHNWQVLAPPQERKAPGTAAENPLLMSIYKRDRRYALVSFMERFRFVTMETLIKCSNNPKVL
jgi:glycosyltransferase involved in cell wall biosynthesis